MKEINLDELTPEQLAVLENRLAEKKEAEKKRQQQERETYKELVTKTVREQIIELQQVSNMLSLAKAGVYGSFASIIELKQELYGAKSGQQSHTFSDEEGNAITIGWRTVDKYDDTMDMGISLVREHMASMAKDENSAKLVEYLEKLLKKDAKGNLKPSRVVELQNMAEKENSDMLTRGVEIIRKSYTPVRSVIFVEAETTDSQQKKQPVALSITSADFPTGFEPNFEVFK